MKMKKKFLFSVFFLFIFFLGAHFYKQKLWPFGFGYYDLVKQVLNGEINLSKMPNGNRIISKIENNNFLYRTTSHLVFEKELGSENFDHISIINDQSPNEVELIGINGNTTTNIEIPAPLIVSKITLDLLTEKLKINEIFRINNNYRATDVLVTDKKRIFISYLTANENKLISQVIDELFIQNGTFQLKRIFSSSFFKPMSAIQTGGKMIQYSENEIMLALGDFANWGYGNTSDLSLVKSELGKTIIVNIDNKKTYFYSEGHRNPQGLTKNQNLILETEHGPEGGDEINLILYNKNYGWPYVSYGNKYNENPEKKYISQSYGIHDNYQKPLFAFIPSIGIKAIEKLPKSQTRFPKWRDNYIVCAKKGIYRVGISSDKNPRILFTEELADNVTFKKPKKKISGCRDLNITNDGAIITNTMTLIKNIN